VAADGAVPAPVTATDAKPAPAPANAADAQPSATKPADAPPQSGAGAQGQPSQPQPGTPMAPAASQESVAATPVTDVPAPAAAAPAAPASQPVQAAPAAVPAPATSPLERAVPLYRAAYATAALIHIASERGITHARINLKPAELGGIEVRLHSSPEGVSARLVADSPEAARALTQAGDDLRRQLEARGVTLLSLDVSTSDDERRQAPAFGGDAAGQGSGSNGARAGAQAEAAPAAAPAETTLVLPDGLLVDVLA
jgi:flagellar hook-length control protein FliK